MANRKKTIAIIGEGFGASGKGLYVTKLFEEIKKKMDLKLYLRDTTINYSGKDVVKLKTLKTKIRFLAGLGYYIPLFFHLLRNKDIKVIHAYDERIGFFAGFLKRQLIVTIHDLSPLGWGVFSKFLFKILYSFSNRAKYIIVDSKSTENQLKAKFPFLSDKIVRIYLGTDLKKFRPSKKRKIGKKIKIGILGSLDSDLKRVFKRLAKEYGDKIEIIIGGIVNPKEFQEFKSYREIKFRGFIKDSDLPKYYRSLDIFVYKHGSEGFGFIPVEAMASGCAVVASNRYSISEVVGEGGLLPEHNEEEFYRAIRKLLDDKKLIGIYSKRGRERAKMFPWKKCIRDMIRIYEEALIAYKKNNKD